MDACGFHDHREVFGHQFADGDEDFLLGKPRFQGALDQVLQIRLYDVTAIIEAFFRNGEATEFVHGLSFRGSVIAGA